MSLVSREGAEVSLSPPRPSRTREEGAWRGDWDPRRGSVLLCPVASRARQSHPAEARYMIRPAVAGQSEGSSTPKPRTEVHLELDSLDSSGST